MIFIALFDSWFKSLIYIILFKAINPGRDVIIFGCIQPFSSQCTGRHYLRAAANTGTIHFLILIVWSRPIHFLPSSRAFSNLLQCKSQTSPTNLVLQGTAWPHQWIMELATLFQLHKDKHL